MFSFILLPIFHFKIILLFSVSPSHQIKVFPVHVEMFKYVNLVDLISTNSNICYTDGGPIFGCFVFVVLLLCEAHLSMTYSKTHINTVKHEPLEYLLLYALITYLSLIN